MGNDLIKTASEIFLFIGLIFVSVIFGTFAGGCSGWIVGFVFGDTILGIASQLGIHGVTMFQLGCFFGFVGGFLRTKVTKGE